MNYNDKILEAKFFIDKLKGALLYRGGNGNIPDEVRKFIESCYKNDIILEAKLVNTKRNSYYE